MRCGIAEDEEPRPARDKLRLALTEYLLDAEERAWVEPRLAHLLGLEEGAAGDQENLFSAWRILFERLAEQSPTVLVFEDVQWADAGLLDFLEYLLDWSRSHPLFVLALARPEFADKRPTWGAGKRSFSSLYLEPLSPDAMDDLLTGLVPGLPDDLRARILERAEGVPLYAVETVRMLLDRGLLDARGQRLPPDRLGRDAGGAGDPARAGRRPPRRLSPPEERRLVEDGAVLGKTFTKQGLAAVTGHAETRARAAARGALLRKEILSVQADPRSPERGQYAFLQDIVKRVAYETLSQRERKAKHLAAAEFLARTWRRRRTRSPRWSRRTTSTRCEAAPDAADAGADPRRSAREMLVRAAERAGVARRERRGAARRSSAPPS